MLGCETKTFRSVSETHPSPSMQQVCSGYCPGNGCAVVILFSVCPQSSAVISTPIVCDSGMFPEE